MAITPLAERECVVRLLFDAALDEQVGGRHYVLLVQRETSEMGRFGDDHPSAPLNGGRRRANLARSISCSLMSGYLLFGLLPYLRALVCGDQRKVARLSWLGAHLDPHARSRSEVRLARIPTGPRSHSPEQPQPEDSHHATTALPTVTTAKSSSHGPSASAKPRTPAPTNSSSKTEPHFQWALFR
jgi:hypothetical protein